jgi:hypothetical protein
MSKTRRNYNEEYYDNEEYGMDIDDYRQHRKEKRLTRALKTRDLEDLLDLEDEEY